MGGFPETSGFKSDPGVYVVGPGSAITDTLPVRAYAASNDSAYPSMQFIPKASSWDCYLAASGYHSPQVQQESAMFLFSNSTEGQDTPGLILASGYRPKSHDNQLTDNLYAQTHSLHFGQVRVDSSTKETAVDVITSLTAYQNGNYWRLDLLHPLGTNTNTKYPYFSVDSNRRTAIGAGTSSSVFTTASNSFFSLSSNTSTGYEGSDGENVVLHYGQPADEADPPSPAAPAAFPARFWPAP